MILFPEAISEVTTPPDCIEMVSIENCRSVHYWQPFDAIEASLGGQCQQR